jgi:hypothetical protein
MNKVSGLEGFPNSYKLLLFGLIRGRFSEMRSRCVPHDEIHGFLTVVPGEIASTRDDLANASF